MARRRTKRTGWLSIIILEVGSLLGIVALAQPTVLQSLTARAASAVNSPASIGESCRASGCLADGHASDFDQANDFGQANQARWMIPARGGLDSKFLSTADHSASADGAPEMAPQVRRPTFDAYR